MNRLTIYDDDNEVIGWAHWECDCPGALGKMHLIPRFGVLPPGGTHPDNPLEAIRNLTRTR